MVARRFKPLLHAASYVVCAAAFLCDWASVVSAQEPVPVRSGRRLSPDAIHTIPPSNEFGETVEGPIALPFVSQASGLAWGPPTFPNGRPNYAASSDTLVEMAKHVSFRRDIWALEFTFKPMRMIAVDIPNEAGEVSTKLVWYLLYRVRYLGGDLQSKPEVDKFNNTIYSTPTPVSDKGERRFLPYFTLNVPGLGSYSSQIIPAALGPIAEKERIGKPLHDSIGIQNVPVKLSTPRTSNEVWGVATWVGVDPRTDFFTVEVTGLTNAQKVEQKDGQLTFPQKTLVLNFSRPGDTINELADEIRYGVPASDDPVQQAEILRRYGLQERLDHYWVYR